MRAKKDPDPSAGLPGRIVQPARSASRLPASPFPHPWLVFVHGLRVPVPLAARRLLQDRNLNSNSTRFLPIKCLPGAWGARTAS